MSDIIKQDELEDSSYLIRKNCRAHFPSFKIENKNYLLLHLFDK